MGILDTLFGESPSTETFDLSTLTPEQQRLFRETLVPFLGRPISEAGAAVPGMSALESTSLAGLEQLAKDLVSGQGAEGGLRRQATSAVGDILSQGPTDFEDFFQTTVRDPALRDFEEDVLPRIGREFGGNQFFGTERISADEAAREDLLESLTRARSDLAFRTRESDTQSRLQAAGLSSQIGTSGDLISLLGAGALPRNIELQRLAREDKRVAQLLEALGLQAKENVVVASGGTEGIAGDLLKLAASTKTVQSF